MGATSGQRLLAQAVRHSLSSTSQTRAASASLASGSITYSSWSWEKATWRGRRRPSVGAGERWRRAGASIGRLLASRAGIGRQAARCDASGTSIACLEGAWEILGRAHRGVGHRHREQGALLRLWPRATQRELLEVTPSRPDQRQPMGGTAALLAAALCTDSGRLCCAAG